jgi:hypothetical protein
MNPAASHVPVLHHFRGPHTHTAPHRLWEPTAEQTIDWAAHKQDRQLPSTRQLAQPIFYHAHVLLSTQNTELLAQQTQKQGPCTEQDCHATLAQENTELLHSFHGIIQLSPDTAAGGPAAAWYTLP